MLRAFFRPSSGAQWLQWQRLVLPSYRGDSRAVLVVGPARPRTQRDCHHDTKVKPEAVTAVIEVLMMGGKTPETCWAVNKCQDNKLKNCCIWLVTYLNGVSNFVIIRFVEADTWHEKANSLFFRNFPNVPNRCYVLPTQCMCVFCMDRRTNSDYLPI